jgi:SPP1 gp7 family putative phage head morphogenesis protein
MVKSVNEKLLDRYIRHAVQIERFKSGEAKRLSNHLGREVFPELIDKLMDKLRSVDPDALKKSWAVKRLKKLTASIDKIIIAGMGKAEDALVGNLMDLSDMEVDWTKLIIERTVPLDISMSIPSTEALRQAVLSTKIEDYKLKTWLKSYKKSVRMDMMKSVSKGIAAGESVPQIGRRLRNTANKGRKQAEHLARTAVSSVTNKARQAVYEKNTDLIKGVLYVSTLDTRTTIICINLDGKQFPVEEGPRPPMHFNCRSTTIPMIVSWKEFGIKDPPPATRASMTGAVPAKTTYKGWLRKQPASVQDEILGKTRGRLYRSGEVKIDRFISSDYNILTLDQLKVSGIKID